MYCLMLTEWFKDRDNRQETRISWFCTQLFLFCYYETAPNTIKHKSFEIRALNTQRSVSEKHFQRFPKHEKTTSPNETFRAKELSCFNHRFHSAGSPTPEGKPPKNIETLGTRRFQWFDGSSTSSFLRSPRTSNRFH